ncbi:MAG TPA: hypothetical protein ENK13_04155 [Thermopetrobacter sp.]|nr:hypothetical protein [Thermopetrobacter sp.]
MKTIAKILAVAGTVGFLAAPALAGEGDCKSMLDQVSAAMEKAQLDDAAKKAVEELKMKAEDAMKAGDEATCKTNAGEALKALGVAAQ